MRSTPGPDENEFLVSAIDSLGQSSDTTLIVSGQQWTDDEVAFDLLADVSDSLIAEYGLTSLNDDTGVLYTHVAIRNTGGYHVDTPLLIGVTNMSDPTVKIRGFDGLTPNGIPYFDFSDMVDPMSLEPGDISSSGTVSFYNPERGQFSYELVVLGSLNTSPAFVSVPDVEKIAGRPYSYDAEATDVDGDTLTYSLVAGPTGATIEPTTGKVSWHPQPEQIAVANPGFEDPPLADGTLLADDVPGWVLSGNGGVQNPSATSYPEGVVPEGANAVFGDDATISQILTATLSPNTDYKLQVDVGLPLDAPHFPGYSLQLWAGGRLLAEDSSPIPAAGTFNISTVEYFAPFTDTQLGEPLEIRLVSYGDRIHFDNLRLSAAERFQGNHGMVLRVQDGRGGSAEQHYTLSVIEPPPNRPPVFTSVPIVEATVNGAYAYDAVARDADDDPLSFSLVARPAGMTVDTDTGYLRWTPIGDQVGVHHVDLEVSDGRGGMAVQSFEIMVVGEPGNHAPVITTEPKTVVAAGEKYRYDMDAFDPDDDPVTYSLTDGSEGMTIDPETGVIAWDQPQGFGTALDFDGVDDYIEVPHSPSLDLTGDFTISLWCKPMAPGNGYFVLLEKRGPQAGEATVPFSVFMDYTSGRWGSLGWIIGDGGDQYAQYWAEDFFTGEYGKWVHVAVTLEDTEVHAYKNGALVFEGEYTGTRVSNNAPLQIGRYYDTSHDYHWTGEIDEVRMWNVARTAEDILHDHDRLIDPASPGLAAYWRFDEGEGNQITDLTGLVNDTTLGGDGEGTDAPRWACRQSCQSGLVCRLRDLLRRVLLPSGLGVHRLQLWPRRMVGHRADRIRRESRQVRPHPGGLPRCPARRQFVVQAISQTQRGDLRSWRDWSDLFDRLFIRPPGRLDPCEPVAPARRQSLLHVWSRRQRRHLATLSLCRSPGKRLPTGRSGQQVPVSNRSP